MTLQLVLNLLTKLRNHSLEFGDTHNFGLRTEVFCDWVKKPRTIYWEWLFLSVESPLREFARQNTFKNELVDPFLFYPSLKFKFSGNEFFINAGEVEKLSLQSPSSPLSRLSRAFGYCLCNNLFWGVTDLHFENVLFGSSECGEKDYFCPIDIESIFINLDFASDTFLLQSMLKKKGVVGSKIFFQKKLQAQDVIFYFLEALSFYQEFEKDLINIINNRKSFFEEPIRCILRPTSEYYEYFQDKNTSYNFFKEEVDQLERGDVPYFFTYIGSPNIYYFASSGKKIVNSNLQEVITRSLPVNLSTKNLSTNISRSSVLNSMLQIARTLDPGVDQKSQLNGVFLKYQEDRIYLKVEPNIKLTCTRLA